MAHSAWAPRLLTVWATSSKSGPLSSVGDAYTLPKSFPATETSWKCDAPKVFSCTVAEFSSLLTRRAMPLLPPPSPAR
eukprot:6367267-Pyramimonas_sp.AAC.1